MNTKIEEQNKVEDNKELQEEQNKVEDDKIDTVETVQEQDESTVKKTLLDSNVKELKEDPIEDYDPSIFQNAVLSEEVINSYVEKAKNSKLTKEQATEIFNLWNNLVLEDNKKNSLESETAAKTLKEEWGRDYDFNLSKASYTAEKFGGKEFIDFLNKSGLGNNTQLIKTFHNISKNFIEDKFVGVHNEQPPPAIERWHGMAMLKFKM